MASLENSQQLHNRFITAIGNNSGSNDHNQHKHDMNSKLIASAGQFAAGKTLGLSEEEVLAVMSRELRRQKRKDQNITMQDIERQMAQAQNSLADVSSGAEIQGVSVYEAPEVDPFGQDQGQYYEYGPNDSQYGEQELARRQESMMEMEDRRDPTSAYPEGRRRYDRDGQVVLKTGVAPEDYYELETEISQMREASQRDQVAPVSTLRDALARLDNAETEQAGFRGALARVFGGGANDDIARVAGRLEDNIDIGPNQRAADKALAAELSNRDLDQMSRRIYGYNQVKAALEAEQIGEALYQAHIPGAITGAMVADENLAAIRPSVNPTLPMAAFTSGGVALDPSTGNPIGIQGPEYVTPNTDPGSGLNAPMTSRSWMVEKQPGYSEGGRSFGNYPQVDVTGATTLFANRLRGVDPKFSNISSNIRSVDELQRAADAVIAMGGNFTTREPIVRADGKTVLKSTRQAQPDIRGVLNKMRYTPAQEQALANAMYQMEVAAGTEINQQGKQQYFTRTGPGGALQRTGLGEMRTPGGAQVIFNAPEAIDPRAGQAPVARINPGQTIEGADIGSAFRKLTEPGARQPFIGAVETVDPQTGKATIETDAGPGYINRYNTTGETDPIAIEQALRKKEEGFQRTKAKKSRGRIMPVDEKGLRGKVVKAQLTEERAKRDDQKRREKERAVSQYTMANPSNVGRVVSARRRLGA